MTLGDVEEFPHALKLTSVLQSRFHVTGLTLYDILTDGYALQGKLRNREVFNKSCHRLRDLKEHRAAGVMRTHPHILSTLIVTYTHNNLLLQKYMFS